MPAPGVPSAADQEATADASWSAVLGYAHQHGLQFGTDIAFTYGPLGFLATPFVAEDATGLRLLTDALLSLATAVGLVVLAWHLKVVWRCVLVGTAVFLLGNIEPRSDLLIEAGLACWGLLTVTTTGGLRRFALGLFVALAAFAALVKISLLVIAGLSVGLLGLDCLARGERKAAWGITAGFGCAFLLGWTALGQSPLHLGAFIAHALSTSHGYNWAMSHEGSRDLKWRGVFTVLAATAVVLVRALNAFEGQDRRAHVRRAILSLWLCGLLFLVWKHGFVRTDRYHAGFYLGFVALLVLALEALPTARVAPRIWGRAFALACWFTCLVTAQSIVLPGDLKASLIQPLRSLRQNAASLIRPAPHQQEIAGALAARRDRSRLPHLGRLVGSATIDMFGCDQTTVLCNDLNYHPRPVFQSYAAYNAPLMRLNEQFYLSAAAPEYVLFCLMGMDRKFPPLEDARTLRHLLMNYELAATEGPFLLLKSRAKTPAALKLLLQGSARPGQPIDLGEFADSDLWMEIDLEPSARGRVYEVLYQPPTIRLALWHGAPEQTKPRRFRAPVPMLAAGFLVSPLLLNNQDVLDLYQGKTVARPRACAIQLDPGTDALWQRSFAFRLYQVQGGLARAASAQSAGTGPSP